MKLDNVLKYGKIFTDENFNQHNIKESYEIFTHFHQRYSANNEYRSSLKLYFFIKSLFENEEKLFSITFFNTHILSLSFKDKNNNIIELTCQKGIIKDLNNIFKKTDFNFLFDFEVDRDSFQEIFDYLFRKINSKLIGADNIKNVYEHNVSTCILGQNIHFSLIPKTREEYISLSQLFYSFNIELFNFTNDSFIFAYQFFKLEHSTKNPNFKLSTKITENNIILIDENTKKEHSIFTPNHFFIIKNNKSGEESNTSLFYHLEKLITITPDIRNFYSKFFSEKQKEEVLGQLSLKDTNKLKELKTKRL